MCFFLPSSYFPFFLTSHHYLINLKCQEIPCLFLKSNSCRQHRLKKRYTCVYRYIYKYISNERYQEFSYSIVMRVTGYVTVFFERLLTRKLCCLHQKLRYFVQSSPYSVSFLLDYKKKLNFEDTNFQTKSTTKWNEGRDMNEVVVHPQRESLNQKISQSRMRFKWHVSV